MGMWRASRLEWWHIQKAVGCRNPQKVLGTQEVSQLRQARFHKVALDMCWRAARLGSGEG